MQIWFTRCHCYAIRRGNTAMQVIILCFKPRVAPLSRASGVFCETHLPLQGQHFCPCVCCAIGRAIRVWSSEDATFRGNLGISRGLSALFANYGYSRRRSKGGRQGFSDSPPSFDRAIPWRRARLRRVSGTSKSSKEKHSKNI